MKILENCPDLSPEWLLTGKGERTNDNLGLGDRRNKKTITRSVL